MVNYDNNKAKKLAVIRKINNVLFRFSELYRDECSCNEGSIDEKSYYEIYFDLCYVLTYFKEDLVKFIDSGEDNE